MAGKWIERLTAATPLPEAARRVLTVRLEAVRGSLPLAVYEPDKDPEHVHQLRVGTRRARAGLDIFSRCLPAKVYRKAKKTLRAIRRAAGDARDWDVFLADLSAWKQRQGPKHQPGLTFLTGFALGHRVAAQGRLEEVGAAFLCSFDRFIGETVAAVHKPDDHGLHTLQDLAGPLLSGLLDELDQAASQDLDDYDHLHRIRILGKRLRYAMEVFASCFTSAFRDELYPAVEEMQDILGEANDSHVAGVRLEALRTRLQTLSPEEWKRLRTGVEGLLRYHRERLLRASERFQAWWQRGGGEETIRAQMRVRSP